MLRSGAGYFEHLHFVLNDPFDFDGEPTQSCLLVSATTIKDDRFDGSCVLSADCHRFITHDSYVAFHFTEVRRASELERLVSQGVFREHDPVDMAFVKRLLACMLDSPRASRRYKSYAKQIWNVMEPKI